ncbi:MAG: carboxymuconolactone decarboxylase family protein [Bacteroidetes bacterium]|nr:carboxymuconolactone decarboxylase family protein [Bacteroidota bacterium]
MLNKRISKKDVSPNAYTAMMALENYIASAKLNPLYKEMIKIRASQINGCAYCIDMHTKDARNLGESERRIYALSAWRESSLFSEEERALLAATEELTNISINGLSDEAYNNLIKYFDPLAISEIIMINVTINSWNRIAISIHSQYED